MKTQIMLDLETMGMKPGSAVIAVGAVKFGDGKIFDQFYRRIDLQSCVDAGLTIDVSTIYWWFKQNEAARLEITQPGDKLAEVMEHFSAWCDYSERETHVWGNGASFDNVLLVSAAQAVGINFSWAHLGSRCYRTVKNLCPHVQMVRDGTHHNALDDARSQAMHLMAMLPSL